MGIMGIVDSCACASAVSDTEGRTVTTMRDDEQWCIQQIYIEPTYSGVFICVGYMVRQKDGKERTVTDIRKIVRVWNT